MKYINETKTLLLGSFGLAGTFVANTFGGWDTAMATLVIFMAIDYFTGIAVAGFFKKSKKSENGALESKAGWQGLFKKGMALLIVLVAHRLDVSLGSNFIRDAAIIGYIANELLSIVENAGIMGVPIPGAVTNAIDMLEKKEKVRK